jgi:transcriptional regulator with XRE-family HTH domain
VDELTIIEVTSEGIVAVSKDGQRFLLPVTDALRSSISHRPTQSSAPRTASPKEIQTLLRAGLTVDEVAERTGTSSEHVARYEAPIIAELQFILERALAVPVRTELVESTFGLEIEERITEQGGRIARWQAYRLDDEWIVGARFAIGVSEDDATWVFDPRRMTLHPNNQVAVRMSSADQADAALFPPLRVVKPQKPTRFDSGEFEPIPPAPVSTFNPGIEINAEPPAAPPVAEPAAHLAVAETDTATVASAEPLASEPPAPVDLLETLNRKRGERDVAISVHPSTGSIPIISPEMLEMPDDAPIAPDKLTAVHVDATSELPPVAPQPEPFVDPTPSRARRQRAQMPTWDEIVFGTRPDDE